MKVIISLLLVVAFISCNSANSEQSNSASQSLKSDQSDYNTDLSQYEKAYFASGCFWCVEAVFESVIGVEEAISGYSGGSENNPTYSQVSSGLTGHAEAVEVHYDPKKVTYHTLVKVYYGSHNPITVNGQAPDFGKQYRSIIFYQNEDEKSIAKAYKDSLEQSGTYSEPLATEIIEFDKFYKAEEYHQNYEKLNPEQPYVKNVSIPRLNKFKEGFPELLKKEKPNK